MQTDKYNRSVYTSNQQIQAGYLYNWKDGWLASMPIEIGPTITTAACKSSSDAISISIQLVSVAPMSSFLNFSSKLFSLNVRKDLFSETRNL
jgi:hypothetical protein